MRGMFVLAVALMLFGAPRAQAQARGGHAMPMARGRVFVPAGAAPARFSNFGPSQIRLRVPITRISAPRSGSPVTSRTILPNGGSVTVIGGSGGFGGFGFNGFGFNSGLPLPQSSSASTLNGIDFNQLAFDQRQRDIQAIIDPITQHEIGLFGRFRGFGGMAPISFVPIWGGYGGYDGGSTVVQSPPPQVIVIEQPAPQVAPAPEAVAQAAPQAAAAPPEAPLPPLGQFSLVRRDGTVISSVAFTVHGDQIVYITADGSRHVIGTVEIDLKATEERNAEHGTILHLTQ